MKRITLLFILLTLTQNFFAGDFYSEIKAAAEKIRELDKDKMHPVMKEHKNAKNLFAELTEKVPESFKKTLTLVRKFNPKSKTNDHKRLNKEIDQYLEFLQKLPVIKYALEETNTKISDFKKNWFGSGLGFEHVICGELKGSKVSGHHWWYGFYMDEKDGNIDYSKTLEGHNDPHIFTGAYSWDPDGNGPLNRGYKRKGGFTVGDSAPAILALGHMAMELAKKNGIHGHSLSYKANISGNMYNWKMYLQSGTIRSMFPMVLRTKRVSTKQFNELFAK
jgi:hypothetical protein